MDIKDCLNKIICSDSLTILKQLPTSSIDLIVTSPPYNIRNSSGNGFKSKSSCTGKWRGASLSEGYGDYTDCMPHGEYVKWQREILTECIRLLKDNGAIFYNHKWRVQKGLLQDRQDIVRGFPVRQIIIWQRSGGFNFNDSYFLPTYEVIYLIAKPKFKLVKKASGQGDIWKINQERGSEHPAAFPIELPTKIIASTSADIILDPFSGSGTTLLAAKNLNRQYIGIELSQKYCNLAASRLNP